jgi:hypothetical protein
MKMSKIEQRVSARPSSPTHQSSSGSLDEEAGINGTTKLRSD